ncbi:MAG TPA: hypothetical protein VFP34_13040 [Microlunatus sp.]|nr:hypothetical protein [Microlunatus sp.]
MVRTTGSRPARFLLADRAPEPPPDPVVILRKITAEALILQDEAEEVLMAIARNTPLGLVAPRAGPLTRRFFALADALPAGCADPTCERMCSSLRTIFNHHAMQLATALDFLAVAGRSDRAAEQLTRIGGLGEPGRVLENHYRQLVALG